MWSGGWRRRAVLWHVCDSPTGVYIATKTVATYAPAEDHLQEAIYFLRDFMMDRICCFLPPPRDFLPPPGAGAGRWPHSLPPVSRSIAENFRNSATSRWALRKAAGLESVSPTVFPLNLRVRRKWGP